MKKLLSVHPFLLAITPIIFLWAHNFEEVEPSDVVLPVFVSLGACCLIVFTLRFLAGNYEKSAITASLLFIVFFSYGHIFLLISDLRLFKNPVTLHLLLGIYLAILLSAILAVLWRTKQDLQQLAVLLTIIPAVIICFSSFTVLNQISTNGQPLKNPLERALHLMARRSAAVAMDQTISLPDIYYIILDSYSRADSLKKCYNFDNSEFINFLKDRGFYVGEKSFSNYPRTIYSLSSSLNIQYLADGSTEHQLIQILRRPLVPRYLQKKGYKYVHFNTYAFETRKSYIADITYDDTRLLGKEFIRILLRTTALMGLEKYEPTRLFAENTLYMLRKAREIPAISGPTFTFLHLYPPHHPFVFDKDGNYIGEGQPMTIPTHNLRNLYVGQIMFINNQVKLLIDYLLEHSPNPPIIILQADHGGGYLPFSVSHEWDRLSILNAYYVPENCRQHLYSSISPVNTFRVILDSCFGEKLEILPDISYIVEGSNFIRSKKAVNFPES